MKTKPRDSPLDLSFLPSGTAGELGWLGLANIGQGKT